MKQSTILITIGSREFTAELEDNAAADALRKQLPLDVTMREFNGNEKMLIFRKDFRNAPLRPAESGAEI